MAERVITTKALKKLDTQLECSLCLDDFKQPKLLPCFHVFCKSPCLEKLVTKDGRSLTCPTCRHIVPLSERGVAGLQSDFHIDNLFEIRDAFNKAEDDDDQNCGNCEAGKATGFCNDCEEFLCNECQTGHKKYMKKHELVSLKDSKSQITSSLVTPKMAIPNCPQHSSNPLKIYCDTCSTPICTDCTIQLHKDHNYDLVVNVLIQHKEELVSSLKQVKEKLVTVQQTLKIFDTRVKVIQDQRVMIEADIHREIDAQHALLDQRKTELVDELEILTKQKLKALATQKDHVKTTEAKLSSCVKYAEDGLKTSTDDEILEMKVPILKRVEQISAEFDPNTIAPETMADMKIVPRGKEHLQQACRGFLRIDHGLLFSSENSKTTGNGLRDTTMGQTKTVYFEPRNKMNKKFEGQLDLKAEFVHSKSKDKLKCEVIFQNGQCEVSYRPDNRGKHELYISVNEVPVRGSPFPITVTGLPGKPVRVVKGLNKPRSVVVNSKGQSVVIDDNGASVSVLTAEGEKIRNFKQISNAYGVTVDKDDNIYVVEIDNRRIRKFSAEGKLLATAGSYGNGREQFDYPVGICYNHGNNRLYVNDNCNHRIQVLTTDLKFVQCFGNLGSMNGQFRYPHYAAFNSFNKIYVTDNENERVQVFTAGGQFLKAFSQKANGQKLKRPWAIAIDSNDTVYVSEKDPNCVSVFTSQGEYITTIGGYGSKEGQFYHPWGLTIDRNDSVIVSDYKNCRLQIF